MEGAVTVEIEVERRGNAKNKQIAGNNGDEGC